MFKPTNITQQLQQYIELLPKNTKFQKHINNAEEIYMLPFFGEAFYSQLKIKFLADTCTADELTLVSLIQNSLANYSYILAIPQLQTQASDSGLNKATSELTEPATEEDFYIRKLEAIKLADFYLDKALLFAYKNITQFPKTDINNSFLKSFDDFKKAVGINIATRIFLNLASDIEYALKKYIHPILTQESISDLHNKYTADTLSDIQKKAYYAAQKTIAIAAILTYIPKHYVSFIDNTLSMFSIDVRGLQTKKEEWKALEMFKKRMQDELDFIYADLINLIKQNPTEFPNQPAPTANDDSPKGIENGKIIFL